MESKGRSINGIKRKNFREILKKLRIFKIRNNYVLFRFNFLGV
jgi:hypothetical protein